MLQLKTKLFKKSNQIKRLPLKNNKNYNHIFIKKFNSSKCLNNFSTHSKNKTKKYIGVGHKTERTKSENERKSSPLFVEGGEGFEVFHSSFQEALKKENITTPTNIQALTWKSLQKEGDVVIHSPTGTGKTLAYLLPALQNMKAYEKTDSLLKGLILVPSKQLGSQVLNVVQKITCPENFRAVSVFGDYDLDPTVHLRQIEQQSPNLIVATPDRLLTLSNLGSNVLSWDHLNSVVLDEADKLLKPLKRYATESQIQNYKRHPKPSKTILNSILQINPTVNILCASATVNHPLQDELRRFRSMRLPLVRYGEVFSVPGGVSHGWIECDFTTESKAIALRNFIEKSKTSNFPVKTALLFIRTGASIIEILKELEALKVPASLFHQHFSDPIERVEMIEKLQESNEPHIFIVNQDIGRGIDLDVSHVFLFGTAEDANTYLHLAGRTGRLNRRGHVVSFVTGGGIRKLNTYASFLDLSLQEISL